MIRGLYTSTMGMTTQMKRMDVAANNIANVNTTGFKKDISVTRSFTEELMSRLDHPGDMKHSKQVGNLSMGIFVDDIYTDFSTGALTNTNGSLDLSISGSGFFAVSVTGPSGTVEKYTRDGAFTMTAEGTLVTKTGDPVVGENGPINLPNGSIVINETGQIYVNDELVDTLRLVDFEDLHTLRKTGDNYYETTDESVETAVTGSVLQGFLENSNVNTVQEMIELININRNYEANQRVITVIDTTMQKVSSEIGRK